MTVKVKVVDAVENGGSVVIEGGDKAVTLEIRETPGFWFDHPAHGRVWVRCFESDGATTPET